MPTVKLTARNVATLPPGDGVREEYLDEGLTGFRLRVSPSGARTFGVAYFRNGKLRRYTIGRTPPLSLADARDMARRLLGEAATGADPQGEKLVARKKRAERVGTFGALCERFLGEAKTKDNLPLRATTLYNWRNIAQAEIIPALGAVPPGEITRKDVRRFVEGLAAERPYWANRVFELTRRVFSWAVEKDLLAASPCVGLKKPGGEKPRERVLSSDEIRSVWSAVESEGTMGQAVRLLFLTAARPREVLDARWLEIDLEERVWRIPSARMKNREPHIIPLSTVAMAVLETLKARTDGAEWLFPSPATQGPIVGVAKWVDRLRARSGVGFQLRDIRRTVRTRLREMGVLQDVSEAILSHAPPRLIRTYDRYQPVPEMRAALEAWGTRLEALVGDAQPTVSHPPARRVG